MIGTTEDAFEIGSHDEFLSAQVGSGSASRLSLMTALCRHTACYSFRASGRAQFVVEDFCRRLAPDLPECHLPSLKVVVKILGSLVLAVLSVYRMGMIPQPWRSVLNSTFLAAILLVLVLAPRFGPFRSTGGSARSTVR